MTDIYEWYYSQDDESWELAPGNSRWDTIRDGLAYYNGESFKICRATKHDFPFHRLFDVDDMDRGVIKNDCEMWGEHQDSIFTKVLTREQKNELEDVLTTTFKDWLARNNIDLEEPWAFADVQDVETIYPENYSWVWTQYRARLYEVNHDDGFGYEEDVPHQLECWQCEKNFVFYTSIHFFYEAEKADCLNGSPHNLKPKIAYPREYSRMCCEDCSFERKMTDEERAYLGGRDE